MKKRKNFDILILLLFLYINQFDFQNFKYIKQVIYSPFSSLIDLGIS